MRNDYGIRTVLDLPFTEAVGRTRNALAAEGFGVLSEIDLKEKLREKLGVEVDPYIILGACNPPLAYKALQAEPEIGLLLPCNVIVYATSSTQTVVAAVDPDAMLSVVGENAAVAEVAKDARNRLLSVIASLKSASPAVA
ncbi:MAG TPA: DUF302 domain-containing protein [Thermoanaerobaculia bacterium]